MILRGLIVAVMAWRCSNPEITGTQSGSSGKSESGRASGSATYLAELKNLYYVTPVEQTPYGLWNTGQTIKTKDGKGTLGYYIQISQDGIQFVAVCVSLITDSYLFVPILFNEPLKEKSPGIWSWEIKGYRESEITSRGFTCSSIIPPGRYDAQLNAKGNLLWSFSGTKNTTELFPLK